jgi:prevent-host-death family protein
MLNTNYVSVRDIQRNYKKVGEKVNKTDIPAIVMRNQEPQFVIISLNMFKQIQQTMPKATAKHLLDVVNEVEKLNIQAPKDLSEKHNEYAWDK